MTTTHSVVMFSYHCNLTVVDYADKVSDGDGSTCVGGTEKWKGTGGG